MDEFTNVRPVVGLEAPAVLPERMKKLPWSAEHNLPIPWFVEKGLDGQPDFRLMRTDRIVAAVNKQLCWVCGERLGKNMAFVLGPMCAVTRVSSEPPSHKDCAVYAARTCPFLSNPNRKRRDNDMPDDVTMAGLPILRNPGVALVWVTLGYRAQASGPGQILIDIGNPVELLWYAEGRRATRVEVEESINSGLPILQEQAAQDGPAAMAALASAIDQARLLLQTV